MNNDIMKFSVVIPMHNKQDTISRAIFSVLGQLNTTGYEIEIIIIDDGSTDGSLSAVKRIQKDIEQHRLILYSQPNAGVSVARNKGVELASTDLITFLDADDSYEPNFIDEIAILVKKFPNAGLYSTAYRFINPFNGSKRNANLYGLSLTEDRQLLNCFFTSASNGDLPVTSSSVCIKKSALSNIGGFPSGESMGEDQAVWSQLALRYQFAISSKIAANYFEGSNDSLMNTIEPKTEMPFSQRLQKQLNAKTIDSEQVAPVNRYIAGHLLDLTRRNIKSGELTTALTFLNDHRSRNQFRRWLFWSIRLVMKLAMSKASGQSTKRSAL